MNGDPWRDSHSSTAAPPAFQLALGLTPESAELARQHHFLSARFQAYDMLAGVAIDYERYDEALHALEFAKGIFIESIGQFNLDSLNASWALCHIGRGQWQQARVIALPFLAFDLSALCRSTILHAAAVLRVLLNDGSMQEAEKILRLLLSHGDRLFRHSGTDQLALAVAIALDTFSSRSAAASFAQVFLNEQRRDLVAPPKLLIELAS